MKMQEMMLGLERCTGEILGILAAAPDDKLFRRPGEGKWSAAEVVEHLILLEGGVVRILNGSSMPPSRPFDSEVPAILDALADTTRTLYAPTPIAPAGRYTDRKTLVESFRGVRDKLRTWPSDHDATLLCPDFHHAVFGELTGYEWLWFVIGHTHRHVKQMQRALQ